jgi:hypothetical protein
MEPSLAQEHKMDELSNPNSQMVNYFNKVNSKTNRPKHTAGKAILDTRFFFT